MHKEMIHKLLGVHFWVDESRVDEYKAEGHVLVEEQPDPEPAEEQPEPEPVEEQELVEEQDAPKPEKKTKKTAKKKG